jgi:hypothetical protein
VGASVLVPLPPSYLLTSTPPFAVTFLGIMLTLLSRARAGSYVAASVLGAGVRRNDSLFGLSQGLLLRAVSAVLAWVVVAWLMYVKSATGRTPSLINVCISSNIVWSL